MYKHLQDEIYYSDLYDRLTVDECRRMERNGESEEFTEVEEGKSEEEKLKEKIKVTLVVPTLLHFVKGENYVKKSEQIREWMARDRARDERLASANPIGEIRCLSCSAIMQETMRDLQTALKQKDERILFMFECSACGKRRGIYDNGKEFRFEPEPCVKCRSERKYEGKREGNVITTTYTCLGCGEKEVDAWDLDKKVVPESPDPNFEKDRARFCMSEKEGQEYLESKYKLERATDLIKEHMGREQNKDLYDAVEKIKKLTIIELEKLLTPALEKVGYIKLQLSNPEIDRDVIVPFTAYDNESDRTSRASEYDFKRLIKKTLQDTNWRLMSDGVSYRLGILNGRLRGYEGEEDLLKLINFKNGKNRKTI